MERIPNEIRLMIKNRLHPMHRWRFAATSQKTRNIFTENERSHSMRFSKIFANDSWIEEMVHKGMDIAIIERSTESRPNYTGKPILLLAITNIRDFKPEDINAPEFLASLRRQVPLESLEVEYDDFILNISGILEYPLKASSIDAIINAGYSGLKMNVYYYHTPFKVYAAYGVNISNAVCFIDLDPENFISVNILNSFHREERYYFGGTPELPGLFINKLNLQ